MKTKKDIFYFITSILIFPSAFSVSYLALLLLWPKASWGKGLFPHCSSLKEWGQAPKTGQEPGSSSQCRDHGSILLTDLLLMAFSACFLIEPRTTSPGVSLPTMSWALPLQSLIKKMSHRLVCSPILWRHLLLEVSSSQTAQWCQISTNLWHWRLFST